jgi:hypothetical protein
MPSSHRSTSSRRCLDWRSLHADEAYVLDTYENHAKCCPRCADPLGSATLCSQGTPLAAGVAQYLCQRERHIYARRSHPDDVTDRVHLPPRVQYGRWLLEAVQQGLHLNTAGEGNTNTTNQGSPSIRTIAPRLYPSARTYQLQIRPLCSRKKHFEIQRLSHPQSFGIGLSSVRLGVGCNRQRFEVNLRFYPEL